jgi:hypothetical protein
LPPEREKANGITGSTAEQGAERRVSAPEALGEGFSHTGMYEKCRRFFGM